MVIVRFNGIVDKIKCSGIGLFYLLMRGYRLNSCRLGSCDIFFFLVSFVDFM